MRKSCRVNKRTLGGWWFLKQGAATLFCVENEDVLIFLKEGYRNPTGFRRWVKVAQSCDLCYTCVMGIWESKNRHKYLLQYHIISYASIERNCRCQNLPVV